MKNRSLPVVFLLFISIIFATIFAAWGDESADPKAFVLDILNTYSPDSYAVLDTYERHVSGRRKTDFMMYIDGLDSSMIAESLNTAVYEMNHAYSQDLVKWAVEKAGGRLDWDTDYMYFFIRKGKSILVRQTEIFPAREMVSAFPERLRTFRFSYIDTEEETLGTQLAGIYGLLNELNAYFQGTKTSFDLYPYFKKLGGEADWGEYFSSVYGSLYGILEFKLYILKYLLFARTCYPKIYRDIKANRQFWETFISIDREALQLIDKFFNKKDDIFRIIRRQGYEVSEDSMLITLIKDSRAEAYGNHMDIYTLLAEELRRPEYRELIAGITGPAAAGDYPIPDLPEPSSDIVFGEVEETIRSAEFVQGDSSPPADPAAAALEEARLEEFLEELSGQIVLRDPRGDVGKSFVDLVKAEYLLEAELLYFAITLAAIPSICNSTTLRWMILA